MEMINQLEEARLSGSRYFILMVESDRVTYLQGGGKSNDSLSERFSETVIKLPPPHQPSHIHCGITYASLDKKVHRYVTCQHFKAAVVCSLSSLSHASDMYLHGSTAIGGHFYRQHLVDLPQYSYDFGYYETLSLVLLPYSVICSPLN